MKQEHFSDRVDQVYSYDDHDTHVISTHAHGALAIKGEVVPQAGDTIDVWGLGVTRPGGRVEQAAVNGEFVETPWERAGSGW